MASTDGNDLLDHGWCIAHITGEEYIICKYDRLFASGEGMIRFKNETELIEYLKEKMKGNE